MIIKVDSNKVHFTVEIHEKFTILTGDSASNKTFFYRRIADAMGGDSPVKVTAPYPVIAVTKHETASNLIKEDVIYVIDEQCDTMQELSSLCKLNAYFILIFRNNINNFFHFNMLPLSVTSILEFRREGKNIYSVPKYKKYDTAYFGNQKNNMEN